MTTSDKRIKILAFESSLTKEVLFNFLDVGGIEVHLSVERTPEPHELRKISEEYKAYTKITKIFIGNSIPAGIGYDIVIFGTNQYERARLYAETHTHLKVFIPENEETFPEEIDNFRVCLWQTIADYIKELKDARNGKPKKVDHKGNN